MLFLVPKLIGCGMAYFAGRPGATSRDELGVNRPVVGLAFGPLMAIAAFVELSMLSLDLPTGWRPAPNRLTR